MNISKDGFTLLYKKSNQLNLIGLIEQNKTKEKKYAVTCDVCSCDKELFTDNYFQISKASLIKGVFPCGCSKYPKWSKEQMIIRIGRILSEKSICDFYQIGEYIGNKTIFMCLCSKHGWYRTNIDKIITGYSCSKCSGELRGLKLSKPDDYVESEISGIGLNIYDMKRIDRKSSAGDRRYFEYKCMECSNDDMVKKDLCSGVFIGSICDIRRGRKSCRCNPTYKYNEEQIKFIYEEHRKEYGTEYEFVSAINSTTGYIHKIKRLCEKHGVFETRFKNVMLYDTGCPMCSGNNQKEAYINIIKDGETELSAKFGIANNHKNRVYSQNLYSKFNISNIGVWKFKSVTSCKKAEIECKKSLTTSVVSKADMPDGFSETFNIIDIDVVIRIYEKFGGVRV